MKIYLDTSALNRIFDDRSQMRIALEAKAMESILLLVETSTMRLVSSEALAYEVSRNPYSERRTIAQRILQQAEDYQMLTPAIRTRAQQLETTNGVKSLDALHVACAEQLQVDAFLTCDDRLIRRYSGTINLYNPVDFILTITRNEE